VENLAGAILSRKQDKNRSSRFDSDSIPLSHPRRLNPCRLGQPGKAVERRCRSCSERILISPWESEARDLQSRRSHRILCRSWSAKPWVLPGNPIRTQMKPRNEDTCVISGSHPTREISATFSNVMLAAPVQ